MSFVDKHHDKSYVITYKELIFTFIVFSVILIVLFPKDILKQQILAENSNYDLSMLYLKNLLKHSPEDESLMLILAEQSLRSGKKDLSLRLLDLLLKSKNEEYRHRANTLSYELEKENYFYLNNDTDRAEQKKKLKKLFATIYREKMYKEDAIDKWYEEATFVNNQRARYFFLKKKLKKEPNNILLLEPAYYLAQKISYKRDAQEYLRRLQKYDVARGEKWLLDEYYAYLENKEYTKAEKLLQSKSTNSKEWQERLASFNLMRGSYVKASKAYYKLYKNEKKYKTKRAYFYKSVNALQSGNYMRSAALLVHSHEREYIGDRAAREYMLKIYLATGNLKYASTLSKKIFNREYK